MFVTSDYYIGILLVSWLDSFGMPFGLDSFGMPFGNNFGLYSGEEPEV